MYCLASECKVHIFCDCAACCLIQSLPYTGSVTCWCFVNTTSQCMGTRKNISLSKSILSLILPSAARWYMQLHFAIFLIRTDCTYIFMWTKANCYRGSENYYSNSHSIIYWQPSPFIFFSLQIKYTDVCIYYSCYTAKKHEKCWPFWPIYNKYMSKDM